MATTRPSQFFKTLLQKASNQVNEHLGPGQGADIPFYSSER